MNSLEQISLGIEIGNFQSAKLFGHVFFLLICLLAQIYEFNGSNHDQMNQKQCQMITKIATLIHMFMWCPFNAMLIMKSCVK